MVDFPPLLQHSQWSLPLQVTCVDLNGCSWMESSTGSELPVTPWETVENDVAQRGGLAERSFVELNILLMVQKKSPTSSVWMYKTLQWWDFYHINWCRIPSINSINLIFLDLWNWYTSNQENITYICWQFGSVWYICLVRYDNMKIKFQQTMVPPSQGDRILAARLARSTSTPFRHHRFCSLSLSLALSLDIMYLLQYFSLISSWKASQEESKWNHLSTTPWKFWVPCLQPPEFLLGKLRQETFGCWTHRPLRLHMPRRGSLTNLRALPQHLSL